MKHLMKAALALALLSGTSALAQPPAESGRHENQGGARGGGQPAQQHQAAPAPRAAQPAPQAGPRGGGQGGGQGYQGGARGAPQGYQGAPRGAQNAPAAPGGTRGGYQGYQGGARGGESAPVVQGGTRGGYQGAPGGTHAQGAAPGFQGGARGARGVPSTYSPRIGVPGARPGGERPHYSAQYFPRTFQPDRQYAWRGQAWRGQPGYYYRHWGYGDRLPYGWFAAQWFINDYYDYDLPVPPYGYEWVRVGPDALLVDLNDGEVVESVYGIFY
jgi:Ni/Co efflux regulator RcnB